MPNPSREVMFLNALMDDMNANWDNIPFLISLICGFTWLLLLASLTNTQTFGPRIAMIVRMITDIVQFLFIYILQLMAFALVGSMAFVQVQEFNGFYKTILYLFDASFGTYDLAIFDSYERPVMRYIGQAFMIIFLFINLILLLNMVIAMMSDTYALMTEISRGVYNDAVLTVMPQLKMNKYYGGIIAPIVPLNLLVFAVMPFYFSIKDKEKQRRLTETIKAVNYCFVLLPVFAVFVAGNLVLLPLAWLRTLAIKLHLFIARRDTFANFFGYLFLGAPSLLALQVFDAVNFVQWSIDTKVPEDIRSDSIHIISKDHFVLFYKLLRVLEASKTDVYASSLIRLLQEQFKIRDQLFVAINGVPPVSPIPPFFKSHDVPLVSAAVAKTIETLFE